MIFIDNQHAKQITEWCNKHPKESEAYFDEHKKLSSQFIRHEISYPTFHKRSMELKTKYKFLE